MSPIAARSLLVASGLLLGLLLGEVLVRGYERFGPGPLVPRTFEIPYLQRSEVPGLGFEPRPGATLVGQSRFDRGVRTQFNRLGFRGPEADADALDAGRSGDELLVAVLGDSYTAGKGVALENTFGKVAERSLQRRGWRARIVLLGTPAYNAHQAGLVLEHKLLGAGRLPHVVVWQFLLNDVFEAQHYRAYSYGSDSPLARRLRVVQLIGHHLRASLDPGPDWAVDRPETYEGLRALMLELYRDDERMATLEQILSRASNQLRAHGVLGLFLHIPYHEMLTRWSDYGPEHEQLQAEILDLAARAGWENVLSTLEPERAIPFSELILDMELDHHPNARCHRLIGELLAERLDGLLAAESARFQAFRTRD
jgi:hypothetical protein